MNISDNLEKFESNKIQKSTCDYCNVNEKIIKYKLAGAAYKRNKISRFFYFCSLDCQLRFENEKRCKHCSYCSDLKQPPNVNFVLCTDSPYIKSCYEEFMDNYFGSTEECCLCKSNSNNESNKEIKINTQSVYCCFECLQKYSFVATNFEQCEITNDCIFCNLFLDEKDGHTIRGNRLCNECFNKYKVIALNCIE